MRILVESPNCNALAGSNAAVGYGWVTNLAERGHDVHVVVGAALYDRGHPGGRAPDIARVHPIRVRPGRARRLGTMTDFALGARRMRDRLLHDVRPDVVHSVEPGGWLGPRALATAARPYVLGPLNGGASLASRAVIASHLAGLPVSQAKAFLGLGPRKLAVRLVNEALFGDIPTSRALARGAMRKARRILLATDLAPRAIPDGLRDRVRRVPLTGLDLGTFHASVEPSGTPTVLYAGAITPIKGLHLLIDALPDGFELRIAGASGEADAWYEEHCRARAGERATWLGQLTRDALVAEYASADVFCLPSLWDAFGMASVEAMACGTPVVALASGGATAIVVEGTGRLVTPTTPEQTIAGLRAALHDLGGERDRAREAGAAARAHVEATYAWPAVMDAIEEIYAEIV